MREAELRGNKSQIKLNINYNKYLREKSIILHPWTKQECYSEEIIRQSKKSLILSIRPLK